MHPGRGFEGDGSIGSVHLRLKISCDSSSATFRSDILEDSVDRQKYGQSNFSLLVLLDSKVVVLLFVVFIRERQ